MSITTDEARQLLHASALRVTAPRLAVLHVAAGAKRPLSHIQVFEGVGETDLESFDDLPGLPRGRHQGPSMSGSQCSG
jgi:hypothetical protein